MPPNAQRGTGNRDGTGIEQGCIRKAGTRLREATARLGPPATIFFISALAPSQFPSSGPRAGLCPPLPRNRTITFHGTRPMVGGSKKENDKV